MAIRKRHGVKMHPEAYATLVRLAAERRQDMIIVLDEAMEDLAAKDAKKKK